MHGSDDFHLGPCRPGVCQPGVYVPQPDSDPDMTRDVMRAAGDWMAEEEDRDTD